jgi:hypothetical protein
MMTAPDLQQRLEDALEGVTDDALRSQLLTAVKTWRSTAALLQIEEAFRRVTALQPRDEGLRWFFRSWSMTNNSAMCVSGLGNRISMELRDQPLESRRLIGALVSLHRIADEDLGVGNGLLHADLFYSTATTLCGDDAWQSKRYLTPEAAAFKQWKDRCALVDDDLVVGLLTTVVHEIYTHGEVEYLWPLFDGWLARAGWTNAQRQRTLHWVTVHCGGTELEHFGHAVDALSFYAGGLREVTERSDVAGTVATYLDHKSSAMTSIAGRLGVADADTTAAIPVG